MSRRRIKNPNNANGSIEVLDDGSVIITDETDPTKKIRLDPSNVPTGTTRTFNAPTSDGVWSSVPLGAVIAIANTAAWALPDASAIKDGYALCNGASFPSGSNAAFIGNRPDLTDERFLQGFTSAGVAGGANTRDLSHNHTISPITLTVSNIPQLTGSFVSGGQSADHTHTYSGTVVAETQQHTHDVSGRVAAETQEHTHDFVSDGMSANVTHTHSDTSCIQAAGGRQYSFISGTTGTTTFVTGSANIEHTHSGTTAGRSANHDHTYSATSTGRSATHDHTYSGTTSVRSADHSHTTTVTLGTASATAFTPSAIAFSSTAQDIRPKYFNVVYVMRVQ